MKFSSDVLALNPHIANKPAKTKRKKTTRKTAVNVTYKLEGGGSVSMSTMTAKCTCGRIYSGVNLNYTLACGYVAYCSCQTCGIRVERKVL